MRQHTDEARIDGLATTVKARRLR